MLSAEADQTDRAVQQLRPLGLVLTVHAAYVDKRGVSEKCAALACSEATFYRRIEQAHEQLAPILRAQRDAAVDERARVERVTTQARAARAAGGHH